MDNISSIANEAIRYYERRDLSNCMELLGRLYNVTAQAGSLALVQTEDKFKVGKAFALFAVMARVEDTDLLSVAAENAYYCLYRAHKEEIGELRSVAAYYIFEILDLAPETLKDKMVEVYTTQYLGSENKLGFASPYNRTEIVDDAMEFIFSMKAYFIVRFYNFRDNQLLFREKGIVLGELLESVRSRYRLLPIETQNLGEQFSQYVFDEIKDTLYKDYSSLR